MTNNQEQARHDRHRRAFSHPAEPETTQTVRVGLRNMLRYIEKM
nr:MAG TPA: hypothetical protein [Caudoviricetes sp.]